MSETEVINRKILELLQKGELDRGTALTMLKKMAPVNRDIAIIGLACKLPGADHPQQFWSNMENGISSVVPFPKSRKQDMDVFLPEHLRGSDPYFSGGYLENLDQFDAEFFRIPSKKAESIDPYQRLFLETAYEALEEGGYGGTKLHGSKTGVYVGNDHTHRMLFSYLDVQRTRDADTLLGSWTGILASRISNYLNLNGPSLVVDTGCSSGMAAVHTACQAIRNKECTMAITGGINLFLYPIVQNSMLETSKDTTRVFDRSPGGVTWGEGVVVLLLKPLQKAVQDRDHIHAIIKGSALSNNGSTSKLAEMSAEGIRNAITDAWEDAKIDPETITYLEAHGLATKLGDSIELSGITSAFRTRTDKKQFCAIGSTKGNIGHLVAGSGVASLLKVIGALKHKTLPPSGGFQEPNPFIPFVQSAVYVNDRKVAWEVEGTPRRAGINSYGYSGTNCHLIVEEAFSDNGSKEVAVSKTTSPEKEQRLKMHIFTLSATNETSLIRLVNAYISWIEDHPSSAIGDLCHTANTGRGQHEYRLAIPVTSLEELLIRLQEIISSGIRYLRDKGIYAAGSSDTAITESQRRKQSETANLLLQAALQDRKAPVEQTEIAREICQLFVNGAVLDWKLWYKDSSWNKLSVPVYPFNRTRHWAQ
ncbi:beta-ketoacyl synthase N-terminal-like domain-containing protein [Paenibacillus sp. B2(2019)]|uniref:beta-ketoacyl synthase N-terminal-like domain-containing protein n=1 Tax=Paenibacillus sp. B2(2019) TaxID=2607754 RepID=UPI0011F1BBBF|nr:polyketide synthase [Paenibacillus sp. B2(2019)]KAA1188678.1 hypothetical protein PAENI_07400 [Paenibacillus sp. B2(2019)]